MGKSVKPVYNRTWSGIVRDVGVICPRCNYYDPLGDIEIESNYVLSADAWYEHKDHLILSTLSRFLPVDPSTYDIPCLAVTVICPECGHRMLMYPRHLISCISVLNSAGYFPDGCHFNDDGTPIARKVMFLNIDEIITALMSECEAIGVKFELIPGSDTIYWFNISDRKDGISKKLQLLQVSKDLYGITGCISLLTDVEDRINLEESQNLDRALVTENQMNATEVFLLAMNNVTDLLIDYRKKMSYKCKFSADQAYSEKYYK